MSSKNPDNMFTQQDLDDAVKKAVERAEKAEKEAKEANEKAKEAEKEAKEANEKADKAQKELAELKDAEKTREDKAKKEPAEKYVWLLRNRCFLQYRSGGCASSFF